MLPKPGDGPRGDSVATTVAETMPNPEADYKVLQRVVYHRDPEYEAALPETVMTVRARRTTLLAPACDSHSQLASAQVVNPGSIVRGCEISSFKPLTNAAPPPHLVDKKSLPWLECEVETSGRTVLCYLPMMALDNADPVFKPYTAPSLHSLLLAQNSEMTTWIIERLAEELKFSFFAECEGKGIVARDQEDAEKLKRGITIAIEKGVIPRQDPPPSYAAVEVFGKSAQEVAEEIRSGASGPEGWKGGVIALVGLSGTGKGTTMEMLQTMLPKAITWSNGNVFRSLTLLAVTHAMHQGQDFSAEFLTPENIQTWMAMLSFGESSPGHFDIRVQGLG